MSIMQPAFWTILFFIILPPFSEAVLPSPLNYSVALIIWKTFSKFSVLNQLMFYAGISYTLLQEHLFNWCPVLNIYLLILGILKVIYSDFQDITVNQPTESEMVSKIIR